MRDHLRRVGAVYILAALFLGSWIAQFASQLVVVANEAADHGESFRWGNFWPQFLSTTMENWQSEFLSNVTTAVLLTLLAHRVFDAAQEDMNALHRKIDHLHARLDHRS